MACRHATFDGPVTASRLFSAFLFPLYPPELHDELALAAARERDANPARNPNLEAELEGIAEVFATLAPKEIGRPDLVLGFDDASVHRLSAALDRGVRDALLARSVPGDPESPLVRLLVHGAVWVGACIVRAHGGAWGVRRPLWESVVHLRSRLGEGDLAPLPWWLKALSDDEVDGGTLASRYRHYVERPTFPVESLRKIVDVGGDRVIPPLPVVRWETLHLHLRAHLPEVASLGADFPSREAFEGMGFLELGFLLLGEGRLLLMHGRGRRGLHLLWLDRDGFSHAAFFPASPGDPHSVEVVGDKLVVRFVQDGTRRVHEMLWWG